MKDKKYKRLIILLGCLLVLTFIICLGIGRYRISFIDTINVFTGINTDKMAHKVVFNYRIPRLCVALLVGGGLAVSGAAFQALFSNPLATPDTLGVATGSSFGAVLGLYLSLGMIEVQFIALITGLIALCITYKISVFKGKSSIILMVLGGIVVSSLFQAMVSFIKYVADHDEVLPSITYWLMGSMSGANYKSLLLSLPFIITGIVVILILRWRLNILSLTEDEATSMGIDVKKLRIIIMIASTMITASSVAMCGQVGWIGLLIPHIVRMIFGGNNNYIVPASVLLGGSLMIVIDTVARSAISSEIPLSILTAFIGAPLFIALLRKTGGLGV